MGTLALIAAGLVSAPSFAQESEAKDWAGIYGLYYKTDEGKPEPTGQLDDGFGLGAEYGFRFDESWAARISASYLDLDGTNGGSDESGPMLGVDRENKQQSKKKIEYKDKCKIKK